MTHDAAVPADVRDLARTLLGTLGLTTGRARCGCGCNGEYVTLSATRGEHTPSEAVLGVGWVVAAAGNLLAAGGEA